MSITEIPTQTPRSPLTEFAASLTAAGPVADYIRAGIIGKNALFDTPFGKQKLVYADYVASGRALRQVEDFVMEQVLPYYANSHTDSSFCGGYMTAMREQARAIILDLCGGNSRDHAAIFSGSGATAALNQLVHLLGIEEAIEAGQAPQILVGPYEHHSNLLPWRESGANVIAIDEAPHGGPDLAHLAKVLAEVSPKGPVICAFSAASNVTGILTDIVPVTKLVKSAGAKMVWDFAGGAPYLPIDMSPEEEALIDAVAISAHKFIGGPGASGLLLVRRDLVVAQIPARPGGGTVAFVNDEVQDYSPHLEEREEGGTPNIIGDIRAALVMLVKDAIGQEFITAKNADLTARAFNAWRGNDDIQLLGATHENRLPILSFIVRDQDGAPVDYDIFTRMLSDIYGIQARGGCACAGPYVHRLLNIDAAWSNQIRDKIRNGDESDKPGFIRLNLSYLMDESEVDYILRSVVELAHSAAAIATDYPASAATFVAAKSAATAAA
ncbi:MAG: aminotransferase class V-fold PLP-dependent enzyme [Alphaproteobacteria bacterium]|nr:aminotransferase class V-fold PLP-dependent enzyme [Alphaproteobacteria bacterium]